MKILVTGGAGYLGSHTVLDLAAAGHHVTVLDNFANSSATVPPRLSAYTGRQIPVIRADIRDTQATRAALATAQPDAVIHFAGLKSVAESVLRPDAYRQVNVDGTRSVLRAMQACGCARLIFSSSAAVYGPANILPVTEDHPVAPASPYGLTKLQAEKEIARWAERAGNSAVILRYFNPVGAHPSGLIGETPTGPPNNLAPILGQVATGQRATLDVFGDDWDTVDGTGVRDYIHVVDLAMAHRAALTMPVGAPKALILNIGTGTGYSVRQIVAAYSRACGRDLPIRVVARRPGDVPSVYADAGRARAVLGWAAKCDLDRMCSDAWAWQKRLVSGA